MNILDRKRQNIFFSLSQSEVIFVRVASLARGADHARGGGLINSCLCTSPAEQRHSQTRSGSASEVHLLTGSRTSASPSPRAEREDERARAAQHPPAPRSDAVMP